MTANIIPAERIHSSILLLRGQKVMLDRDLAKLYGIETKALNQAVSRNKERFPDDFMFELTTKEKHELVTNCDRFESLKHSSARPKAFTEQGVAMLSSVLRSPQAIMVNIAIMRTFVQLRQILESHSELAKRLQELEGKYDEQFNVVFKALNALMTPPDPPQKKIGFNAN